MAGARTHLVANRLESPIGTVLAVSNGARLCAIYFVDGADDEEKLAGQLARRYGEIALEEGPDPQDAPDRLRAYFDGDLPAIEGLEVETGGTGFQRSVWQALRDIPAGGTESYGALAARLGQPGASRAVGLANGRNPVSIVLPCHRVIGANGSLTGYGGGIERKRWLLAHESRHSAAEQGLLL